MKKISKLLFVALVAPLVTGCSLMPQFNNSSNNNNEQSSKPIPIEQDEQRFTITWANWNGDSLEVDSYLKGEWPSYNGATPFRASDSDISYDFSGWAPEINMVTADKTYIAQFSSSVNYQPVDNDVFVIKFVNWDGSILQEREEPKGVIPSYYGDMPIRPDEGDIQYSFVGWSPDISAAYQDTTYVAVFNASHNQTMYTVRFVDWNGTVLQESSYRAGARPRYSGATPTRENAQHLNQSPFTAKIDHTRSIACC